MHARSLVLGLLLVGGAASAAEAQCPAPSRATALTWFVRQATLHMVWVPSDERATGWTVILTPSVGPAITFVTGDARSWAEAVVPPDVYAVSVIGHNECGSGLASVPVFANTRDPVAVPPIVIDEIGPFVEIRNIGDEVVDIGNWHLFGTAGDQQRPVDGRRINELTTVRPGCSVLLGDSDREMGVPVDFRMPALFGYSTSLALATPDGRVVDQVARDATGEANYQPPFGEGLPLPRWSLVPLSDVRSFTRLGDTGDNLRDFVATSPPTPRNLGSCEGFPAPPFNLAAEIGASTVTLSWEWSNGGVPIDAFQIEAGYAPGYADAAVVRVPSGMRGLRFDAVPPGLYFVRVRSVSAGRVSAASNEIEVCLGVCEPLPGRPSNVTWVVQNRDVLLRWSAPAAGGTVLGYVIEAGTAPNLADLGQLPTGSTAEFAVVHDVPPGMYFARIRAFNAQGIGLPSHEVVIVVP